MSKSLNLFGGATVVTAVVLTGAYNFADRFVGTMPKDAPVLEASEANPFFSLVAAAEAAPKHVGKYGLGRVALPEEVAAWNIEVAPDGTGLPEGSGDVLTGEEVFEDNCAACHGSFAEGVDNWPKLAGGAGTLADKDPLKTVGSYWPHLSTVFDYVHRSMPFGAAQTLSADETYAIVAYILYSNDLVDEDFVLSKDNFAEFEMPNKDGFIVDDRPETEYSIWRTEPCMENCKSDVKITMRATVLDVTPDEPGSEDEAKAEPAAAPATEVAAAEPAVEAPAVAAEPVAVAAAAIDADLAAKGEKVFKKCKSCHQVGDKAKNRTGPVLNGIVGHPVGAVEGFKYSKAMAGHGGEWTPEALDAYLADPRGNIPKNKMSFAGLKKEKDRAAVIEYLKTFK